MTKTDKEQILQSYKQQFDALCQQRNFATDMVEHYAFQVSNFGNLETPNFWSLGYAKQLCNLCRQYVKFHDLYERAAQDVATISEEISAIKDMK